MDLIDCDEISSIALESATHSMDESEMNIISKDLSSLSYISISDTSITPLAPLYSNSAVVNLKARLKENVEILHKEIQLYEESNKKETLSRRETLISEELFDQLNVIKLTIEDLKLKLRGSEELIDEKYQENRKLKEELQQLEVKNLTCTDKLTVCHCTIV